MTFDRENERKESEMPDIKFDCPECRNPLTVDEAGVGMIVACPQCSKRIQIPKVPAAQSPVIVKMEPPIPSQPQKTCPFCGEVILAVAKKCKHCGEILDPTMKQTTGEQPAASVSSPPQPPQPSRPGINTLA